MNSLIIRKTKAMHRNPTSTMIKAVQPWSARLVSLQRGISCEGSHPSTHSTSIHYRKARTARRRLEPSMDPHINGLKKCTVPVQPTISNETKMHSALSMSATFSVLPVKSSPASSDDWISHPVVRLLRRACDCSTSDD